MSHGETKITSVVTPADPRWDAFAEALSEAVNKQGCRNDHRLAEQIMTQMGDVDIPGSIEFFEQHGGYCDCEIMFNVVCNDNPATME
jgi:hypothetical protein